MAEDPKVKGTRELQAEIDELTSDKSRDQIEEIIEKIKAPRKAINDFVVKHAEFTKVIGSPEADEVVKACGSVVTNEAMLLVSSASELLKRLEHLRWLVDERIAILRRQEALAKDKYGNERKPLELTPEEQELTYDLRGAALRDSYEQTQAINREFKVTRMLQRARADAFEMVDQPLPTLSRSSIYKLVGWYKRQLAAANKRADEAEEKLAATSSSSQQMSKRDDNRPRTAGPLITVGPADVKYLQDKLFAANRELDYLRKHSTDIERELASTRHKLGGSEAVIERLAKIANRERVKSAQLDRQLTKVTEIGLASYGVAHRTYATPPHLLPTTTGEATSKK